MTVIGFGFAGVQPGQIRLGGQPATAIDNQSAMLPRHPSRGVTVCGCGLPVGQIEARLEHSPTGMRTALANAPSDTLSFDVPASSGSYFIVLRIIPLTVEIRSAMPFRVA